MKSTLCGKNVLKKSINFKNTALFLTVMVILIITFSTFPGTTSVSLNNVDITKSSTNNDNSELFSSGFPLPGKS
ncbi:MAG: hypothetical protein ACFFDW_03555, partial [Candidatus Thorarchaeota archaeon]